MCSEASDRRRPSAPPEPELTLTAVVAAAAGLGAAASIVRTLGSKVGAVAPPVHTYLLTLGCALAASIALLLATLPVLKRITVPDEARFE